MDTNDYKIGIGNQCPEGYYLDSPSGDECRRLIFDTGFSIDRFLGEASQSPLIITVSSYDEFMQALASIKSAGGGIIRIKRGTVRINNQMDLPSNIVIEGEGSSSTVLEYHGPINHDVFRAKDQANIVIRDLTVDSRGRAKTGIRFWYTENSLVERTEIRNSINNAVNFRYSSDWTVRYNYFHHSKLHGIGSKDCFEISGRLPNLGECKAQYSSYRNRFGALWSRNFAVYSNLVTNNGLHGIDVHAIEGEISGNQFEGNGYGGKLYDGQNILFHHNLVQGNRSWGIAVSITIDIAERAPENLHFCSNSFRNNGASDIGMWASSTGQGAKQYGPVLLDANQYDQASLIVNRAVPSSQFWICTDSSDWRVDLSGIKPSSPPAQSLCGKCENVEPYVLDFDAELTQGIVPFAVKFWDKSIIPQEVISRTWEYRNIDEEQWSIFSVEQDPTLLLDRPGNFSVRLTVETTAFTDAVMKLDYINSLAPTLVFRYITANRPGTALGTEIGLNRIKIGRN